MPNMEWEAFQHDHHRPHLLIVSIDVTDESNRAMAKTHFERLAVTLGASGNYAFKVEGTTIYAAFEADRAARFSALLRPSETTREAEWGRVPRVGVTGGSKAASERAL
jgi:hypothetical protein